jgi:hypothetical protein
MFSFYSSIYRLLGSNTQTLKPTESHVSFHPDVINKENIHSDMMLSPNFSMNKIVSKNDTGEIIILEYSKHDKEFVHYKPKYFKYK